LTDGGSTSKPYALIVANCDGQGLIVLGSTTGEEEFDGPIAGPALGPGGPICRLIQWRRPSRSRCGRRVDLSSGWLHIGIQSFG
jgi:hypothetical protein